MKILLTGASGFLGNNLLRYIKSHDTNDKLQLYLLTSTSINGYTCIPHKDYTFSKKDISRKVADRIDVLVHCGAFSPKTKKEMNDIRGSSKNIENTVYLIDNLPFPPKKIIYTSSVSIYDASSSEVIDENTPPNPDSLYGQSKLFCENILRKYSLENHIGYQILRIGVIYGEENIHNQGLIPTTIKKIIDNQNPVVFNGGMELRSFINVYDCCRTIYLAIEKQIDDPIVNVVFEQHLPVIDLVRLIVKISGKNIAINDIKTDKKYPDIVYNVKKSIKNFGLYEIDYTTGLTSCYNYFQKNYRQGL
ncbi:MAG TPA: NAD(P)-dependent oxidoreductase [Chitinivibrionales bacterium]|nr:NAD(P)-dependent oxidoreductase [Chitinivibrionales bacterium]